MKLCMFLSYEKRGIQVQRIMLKKLLVETSYFVEEIK